MSKLDFISVDGKLVFAMRLKSGAEMVGISSLPDEMRAPFRHDTLTPRGITDWYAVQENMRNEMIYRTYLDLMGMVRRAKF